MKKGDKVVCIDDSIKAEFLFDTVKYYPEWIVENTVYTVRYVFDNDSIVPGLLLEEVVNPSVFIKLIRKDQEPAFRLDRFRLLETETMEESEEDGSASEIERLLEDFTILN